MKRKLIKKSKNKYSKLYKLAQTNCMGLSCVISLMHTFSKRNKIRRWERKGIEVLGEPEDFLGGKRKKQKNVYKSQREIEGYRNLPTST